MNIGIFLDPQKRVFAPLLILLNTKQYPVTGGAKDSQTGSCSKSESLW